MDAGNERTCSVNYTERALLGGLEVRWRGTMRREDDDRAFRDLVDGFYGDCTLGFKIGDDMRVVDNFMLYVHGFSVALECDFDYVYGAYDSSTEASGSCQKYLQITLSLDWTIHSGFSEEAA